ncbi:hypothetical protein QBC44DRAFT_369525 [Cladorrhinum sp. PSN332]|nr:hypothetical protein QBC44DRAFT_369525 [Cladorrhinum sp. PSN332]
MAQFANQPFQTQGSDEGYFVTQPPRLFAPNNNPRHVPFVVAVDNIPSAIASTNSGQVHAVAKLMQHGGSGGGMVSIASQDVTGAPSGTVRDLSYTPANEHSAPRENCCTFYFVFNNLAPTRLGQCQIVVEIYQGTQIISRPVNCKTYYVIGQEQYVNMRMPTTGEMQVLSPLGIEIASNARPGFELSWCPQDAPPDSIARNSSFPGFRFRVSLNSFPLHSVPQQLGIRAYATFTKHERPGPPAHNRICRYSRTRHNHVEWAFSRNDQCVLSRGRWGLEVWLLHDEIHQDPNRWTELQGWPRLGYLTKTVRAE